VDREKWLLLQRGDILKWEEAHSHTQ
jgi:hypothetical protein